MNHRRLPWITKLLALTVSILFTTSCSGPLYKVKPAPDLPALPSTALAGEAGGIRIRLAPLLTDEESQDLFEANLPLSGLLPVRMEVNYETGGAPIELKKVKFNLREADGRQWKLLSAKQAVSQILKANGVTLYNPTSRKQFEKEFGDYAFDLKTPLTTAERRRHGFLFFQSPGKERITSPHGLIISAAGLPQPIELRLN